LKKEYEIRIYSRCVGNGVAICLYFAEVVPSFVSQVHFYAKLPEPSGNFR
jgi:hypothetical protein